MNPAETITIRERESKTLFLRLDVFLLPTSFQNSTSVKQFPILLAPQQSGTLCTPTLRVCPQSSSYVHPALRGITVVLSHSDTIVGEQPGQLCTQEAFDWVYWFIRTSKIPEFDFPVAPCRDYEMTVERWKREKIKSEKSGRVSLPQLYFPLP